MFQMLKNSFGIVCKTIIVCSSTQEIYAEITKYCESNKYS